MDKCMSQFTSLSITRSTPLHSTTLVKTSSSTPYFNFQSKMSTSITLSSISSPLFLPPSPPKLLTQLLSSTKFPILPSSHTPLSLTPTPVSKPLTLTTAATSTTISASNPPHTLKTRLKNGETLYGLFLCSFSPTLAEIAGLAGYDYVVIDMEHGYGSLSEALTCLRSLAATSTPAIIRLPESSPTWAKKALDLGPQGLMFPMIESSKEARKAVSYCRYPPNGVRGAAHPIVRASGYGIDAGYLGKIEEELVIMCQVECEDAIEKVDEIAAVDGVDCIQMGPLDLSASMGYLWDPGNKKVREKMRKAEKKVLEGKMGNGGGAYLSGFAMPHDAPLELKKRGYSMVAGAVDLLVFRSAVVEDVNRFKMGLGSGDDDDDDDRTAEGKDGDDKYWSE